jgi:hypothetical protein
VSNAFVPSCCARAKRNRLEDILSLPSPHGYPDNAGAVHLLDAQGIAVEDDLVADLGGAAQPPEDEAAERVEVLALKARAWSLVGSPYAAVYGIRAVVQLPYFRLLLVELVPDLADDLLKDVFCGNGPLEGAPLVHDDGHLDLLSWKSSRTSSASLFSGTTRTSRTRSASIPTSISSKGSGVALSTPARGPKNTKANSPVGVLLIHQTLSKATHKKHPGLLLKAETPATLPLGRRPR